MGWGGGGLYYFRLGQGPNLGVSFLMVLLVGKAQVTNENSYTCSGLHLRQYLKVTKLSTSNPKKRSYHNFWSQTYKSFSQWKRSLKNRQIAKNFSDNIKDDDWKHSKEKIEDLSNTEKGSNE